MFDKSFEEKVSLAISSTDIEVLTILMGDPSSKIRRAVARNKSTPASVLNILAYDPVLNVSYKAMENIKCTVQRCLSDVEHPCVCCSVSEDKMNCNRCKAGANS